MLNHCFPNTAMKAGSDETGRLAHMSPVTAMISLSESSWTGGTAEGSPGIADWLRVRRIAQRRAAGFSFGLDWRLGWTPMINSELTAESRLRRQVKQVAGVKDTQHTKIRVVLRPASYFLTSSVSCSAVSLYTPQKSSREPSLLMGRKNVLSAS
jgi:hypothetical protein